MRLMWALALAAAGFAQPRPSLMEEVGKDNLPAQKLGVDDLVAISVYDAPELTRSVRVEPDGSIHLPLLTAGVQALSLLPRQLEARIVEALKAEQILVNPIVKVTVVEYHSRPIAVMGAVRKPLTFQAVGTVTLLDALARAEGLAPDAGMEILLTRVPGEVQHIAVDQLINKADPSVNILLHGGEEIRVPVTRRIVIVGNVRKPGAFPIRDNQNSMLTAIALVEGLLPFTGKTAYIYRLDETGARTEISLALSKILDRKIPDVALQADDLLYIPDNKGKKLAAGVVDRLAGFGSSVGSGLIVWH